MHYWTRALLGIGLAILLFQSGVSLADGGNCYNVNIDNCVVLDSTTEDVCCALVDGQHRIAACTRDDMWCASGADDWTPELSNGYNFHDVGGACQ